MTTYKNNREAFVQQWEINRDFYNFDVALSPDVDIEKRRCYLPMTEGVERDYANSETRGLAIYLYNSYYLRAFTSLKGFLKKAVNGAKNTIHREPATYEVPTDFEYILTSATDGNDTIEEFHQGITHNQCLLSRGGYLTEIDVDNSIKKADFFFVSYEPERIKSFGYIQNIKKKKYSYIVLDTTEDVPGAKEQFLILGMRENRYFQKTVSYEPDQYTFNPDILELEDSDFKDYRGNYIDEIPFVFITDANLKADYRIPKFSTTARLDWAYLLELADHKQHIHMNSQGLLTFTGVPKEDVAKITTGAGSFFATSQPDAKVAYVGISSDGISAQRESLEDLEATANAENIADLKQVSGESGVARQTILESRTLPLVDVALTSSAGIERLFHFIADWAKRSRDEFKVYPNLNFFSKDIDPALIRELVSAKTAGAPVTDEMIFNAIPPHIKGQEIFEEVKKQIESIIAEPAEVVE